jgi:uncharacterized secreted repeat protein (TIGR03808 family)
MMVNRRLFLVSSALGAMGLSQSGTKAWPQSANAEPALSLRGSLDASHMGMRPGAYGDQSVALQNAIDKAVEAQKPLYLPAGDYQISNIQLRSGLMLTGVPEATRLVYSGQGHLFFGTDISNLRLENMTIDGANRPLADYAPALIHLSSAAKVLIRDCVITGSSKSGLVLDRVQGRITGNQISGMREVGLQSNEAQGLEISSNIIAYCANNGLLVWRWTKGDDKTLVLNNRIHDIRARSGGTGPYGNGINIFRADGVNVSNNIIDNCDFSAIRFNASSHAQIMSNSCTRSGEVAIYAEFGFEGAIIASNVIEDAATGISITNFDHGGRLGIAQGNLLRNIHGRNRFPTDTPTYGIGIAAEADASVQGNLIEEAAYAGIALGWGPYLRDVSATGNVIRKSGMGLTVSVVDGAGDAIITDNVLSQNRKGGIFGMHWLKTATKDLARASGKAIPANIMIDRNRVS